MVLSSVYGGRRGRAWLWEFMLRWESMLDGACFLLENRRG